jgi:hypothetical protein
MKTFLLIDEDMNYPIAAVQTEGLDDGRFLKKAKTAVKEHYCIESLTLCNWVDPNSPVAIYMEGIDNNEPVSYTIKVEEITCY